MKTVLITAYAVNPYKGSEDGTGWNITREIAKEYRVILITRNNNVNWVQEYIEKSKDANLKNIECHGFDLPKLFLSIKKKMGERGYVAYYYLWQFFIVKFIRKKNFQFDLAHSLNFHSDSQANFLWRLGKPTFWGPIGHHPKMNKEYLKPYSIQHYLVDRLYFTVKWIFRNLDPFFRLSVKKSEKIFVINSSIKNTIGASNEKVVHLPAVASSKIQDEINTRTSDNFIILSVGRFHYLKGFDIVLNSFACFINSINKEERGKCKLLLVGKGEEKERLLRISKRLEISDYVTWIDWVSKEEMQEFYQRSSVFFFPSHEGAGMVTVEAMSFGLPIVCFNNVGPGEIAKEAAAMIDYSSYDQSVREFGEIISKLFQNENYRIELGLKAKNRFLELFTWERKGVEIIKYYRYAS